ncbi:hypothetical protein [Herbiconiux liangxiaofengii]|uniref:hypothetical protein n=1 Tax=Herbiconiux liangxiaofengii TaxID=3342795 RepID=UPI0035B82F64
MTVPGIPPLPPSAGSAGLPYPLPPRWRIVAAKRARPWQGAFGAAVTLALAAVSFWAVARGDLAGAVIWSVMFAAVGLVTGVAFARSGDESGLPAMINSVALSKARVRPVDSWVHFFRRSGPSRWQTALFTLTGLGASAVLAWASVRALGAAPWALIVTVPLLVGGLVVALAGSIAVLLRRRHSSFGRRPIGLSLGRHGLVYYYLGDYQSQAWLIYTAVRFWHEHPDARSELSTTFAQRRVQHWRDAMRPSALPPVRL